MSRILIDRALRRSAGAMDLRMFSLIVVLTASLGACRDGDPVTTPTIRPVRTQQVEFTEWRQAGSAIGEIKPRYESDIGFRIAGKFAARFVDVGTVVEKGAILGRLDSTNEQTAIGIAESDVRAAHAELDDASVQESRQRELLRRGFASQVNYDSAQRRLKLATAKLEAAELAKKDSLDRLGYTELRSDDAGIVTAVAVQPGQVVAAGQIIFRIARTNAKEAEFKIAEQTLRSVPRDTLVEVSLVGEPSIKSIGHVREVATTADPLTRTFAVRIMLEAPPDGMRFGATVQGRVVLQERQIVKLESSALVRADNGPAVWVFDSINSTVNLRPVTILHYEAGHVLVVDGLKSGERVVTKGVQKLWPGMKVRLL